jgi:hypothetical protein
MKATLFFLALSLIAAMNMSLIFSGVVAGQLTSNSNYYAPPIIRFASNYGMITNGSVIFDYGNFNITMSVIAPWSVYSYSEQDTVMTSYISITSALYKTNWQRYTATLSPNPFTLTHIPHGHQQIQVTGTVGVNLIRTFTPFSTTPFFDTGSQTLDFTVEAPPKISALSIENKTYQFNSLPLVFNVNGSYAKLDYSLDNLANTTISGNSTLTDISYGSHSIVVHSSDTFGNAVASETINFSTIKSEPFPIVAIAAISVLGVLTVLVVAIGLLVYLKKHKHIEQELTFRID